MKRRAAAMLKAALIFWGLALIWAVLAVHLVHASEGPSHQTELILGLGELDHRWQELTPADRTIVVCVPAWGRPTRDCWWSDYTWKMWRVLRELEEVF